MMPRSTGGFLDSQESVLSPKYGGRIQLLFVNSEDGRYYYRGLSDLTLDKYIWLYFHEKHELVFDCVYFISYSQNKITLKDFGDELCDHFVRERLKWGKSLKIADRSSTDFEIEINLKEVKSPVLSELDKKCSGIFVLLDDMLAMMKTKELNPVFAEYAKKHKGFSKIVVIVPSDNEQIFKDNANVNLLNPLFSNQNQIIELMYKGIKSDELSLRDLLYNNGADNCIFLDRITSDDAKSIVLSILMSDKERFNSDVDIECLIDYFSIVTDEDVPIDRRVGPSYKLKTRKDCYSYYSNPVHWKDLISNSYRLSKDYLMLSGLDDKLFDHKISYTGQLVKECAESYKKTLSDSWSRRKEPCVFFPIMELCGELYELNGSDGNKDYDTQGVIILALNLFAGFIHCSDELSLSNKRYIADDLRKEYLSCIEQSNQIGRQKRYMAVMANVPDKLKKETDQKITELRNQLYELEKKRTIYVQSSNKPQKDPIYLL